MSTAGPNKAPRMSCPSVPTMISVSAVDTRNQIAQRVATTAKLNHRAAKPHKKRPGVISLFGGCGEPPSPVTL